MRLPGLAFFLLLLLAFTRARAGTVMRREAVRTAGVRSVTTRSLPRRREAFFSLRPDPLRRVIPRARALFARAKRTWEEGAITIDRIGGALRPAPTFSDSDGRPLALTVSPPLIVGRPATDQAMGA